MNYKARKTNLKAAYGGWVVRPYKEGALVYYEMYFDVHYIPHMLISKLSRRAMRGVIDAMRESILKPDPPLGSKEVSEEGL